MTETVIYSTLFLTLLLMVGLFFFIRASTKDRTEVLILQPQAPAEDTLRALTTYFEGRAYRVQQVDADQSTIQFNGLVRPSWFLAGFLTFLAAVGCLCFALVLSRLIPGVGVAFVGMLLLAPAAGWFYWQRAGREEQVVVQVRSWDQVDELIKSASEGIADHRADSETLVVTAHRDELIALRQAWNNGLRELSLTVSR